MDLQRSRVEILAIVLLKWVLLLGVVTGVAMAQDDWKLRPRSMPRNRPHTEGGGSRSSGFIRNWG